MADTSDLWYIRFPDGRVLRAAGTAVVRQQLAAGRIPPGTRLRRTLDDEWRPVERCPELADLAPESPGNGASRAAERRDSGSPATIASRLDPAQLGQAGVRTLVEELLGALDSTFVAPKLLAAALVGLFAGALA